MVPLVSHLPGAGPWGAAQAPATEAPLRLDESSVLIGSDVLAVSAKNTMPLLFSVLTERSKTTSVLPRLLSSSFLANGKRINIVR